jgi:hypothetical protein
VIGGSLMVTVLTVSGAVGAVDAAGVVGVVGAAGLGFLNRDTRNFSFDPLSVSVVQQVQENWLHTPQSGSTARISSICCSKVLVGSPNQGHTSSLKVLAIQSQ